MEANNFNRGKLYINGECIDIDNLTWHEHPTDRGVFFKHIISGANTNKLLSYHLVKVNPDCEIDIHNHIGKTELHEIIGGCGHCMIGNEKIDYHKGVIGFIPEDKYHSVRAGKEELFILAKFFPALM